MICEFCGEEKYLKPAGVKKDGTPYDAFWSCKNWVSEKGKTTKAQFKTSPQPQNGRADGFQVIGDTLFRIESKLDILLGEKGLKTEFKDNEIPVIDEDPKEAEWQRVSQLELNADEIDPNSIPF